MQDAQYPAKDTDGSAIYRAHVPEDKRGWDVDYPEYAPIYVNHSSRINKPWADPDNAVGTLMYNKPDPQGILRMSHEGTYRIHIETGAPLNPRGRTGITGPGINGRYGPNHAADLVCTRTVFSGSGLPQYFIGGEVMVEAALVTRKDNNKLAFPGGFCNPRESGKETAVREWLEEVKDILGSSVDVKEIDELRTYFGEHMELLHGGLMDDSRNTDWAWIESSVFGVHDGGDGLLHHTSLKAGDDAADARWMLVTPEVLANMHAGHEVFLKKRIDEIAKVYTPMETQESAPGTFIELDDTNTDSFCCTLMSHASVRRALREALEPIIPKTELGLAGVNIHQREEVLGAIHTAAQTFTRASLPHGCAEELAERFLFLNITTKN